MAAPGEGASSENVERKTIGLAEAKAGVKLRPDRRVVLTVKDLTAGAGDETAGGAPGARGSGEPGSAASGDAKSPAEPADASSSPPAAEEAGKPAANFHVQIELPDGSDYARNKACVLEIPGHPPVEGTTNDSGELVLSVPNVTAESATLRVLDGGTEIATWAVTLRAEDGEGAVDDAQPEARSIA